MSLMKLLILGITLFFSHVVSAISLMKWSVGHILEINAALDPSQKNVESINSKEWAKFISDYESQPFIEKDLSYQTQLPRTIELDFALAYFLVKNNEYAKALSTVLPWLKKEPRSKLYFEKIQRIYSWRQKSSGKVGIE